MGITSDDWEGDLPPDESDASRVTVPAEVDEATAARVAEMREPATQFRFLHEEAKEGGNPDVVSIEMRSEVLIVEWRDASGHIYRQDGVPSRCQICRLSEFEELARIEERTVLMPLKFSQVEIHRKKVYQHLEHFAMMVRASMMQHYPDPELTAEWMAEHRGVVEVGLTAPSTQSVLREMFLALRLADKETIDGITDAALTVAGLAGLGLRPRRAEELAKKATSPSMATTNGHAPGSPASTSSSSQTDTATTTS